MGENLFCKEHKITSEKYLKNFNKMNWPSKREKYIKKVNKGKV